MENLEQNQSQQSATQPQPTVESSTPPSAPQPATQPLTPEPKPEKSNLLPILLSLGTLVLGGILVFVYFTFLKPGKVVPQLPSTTDMSPKTVSEEQGDYTILGLDLTIDKALRVEQEGEKDLLILTVTFEGNEKCKGKYEGQTCGYSAKRFKLKDKDGFVLDQPGRIPSVAFLKTTALADRALAFGEKSQGDVFFEIPKDKDIFLLTYTDNLGKETTGEIEIKPKLFDATADWEFYQNKEYLYEVKYPKEWTLKPDKQVPNQIISLERNQDSEDRCGLVIYAGTSHTQLPPDKKPIQISEITIGGVKTSREIYGDVYDLQTIFYWNKLSEEASVNQITQNITLNDSECMMIQDKILSTLRFLD